MDKLVSMSIKVDRNMTIQEELNAILKCLREIKRPLSIGTLTNQLGSSFHKKTLQRRLKKLVDSGEVIAEGEKKSRTYRAAHYEMTDAVNSSFSDRSVLYSPLTDRSLSNSLALKALVSEDLVSEHKAPDDEKNNDLKHNHLKHPIFSEKSMSSLTYLDTPPYGRTKITYQFALVDEYIPNHTMYLPLSVRTRLHKIGKRFDKSLAAGTYAKQIGQRLLIDLSYNSSRLEGNTYSKLDTQKLIERGQSAEGKVQEETIMIMNHKEAIEFIIENAEEIPLSPFTIRNVHYLLSQDLLANPNACGKEREIEVNIGQSAYIPLGNPHQLKKYLVQLLLKVEQINDPFEQSFFLLMHLSYLQVFEDVNKRTARLSCNIPFIKHNLCPLSFIDVPQKDYFKALLYFYETNELQPALELYEWAYRKSCEQYEVVKESIGEIDAYRILHRAARKQAMGRVIRDNISDEELNTFLRDYCMENDIGLPDKFIAMTTTDLEHLHEGAIIGLGITESIFKTWKRGK